MNTDRFLTRVWDKQEKMMIYKYQKFVYDGVWYVFESVTNDAVIASEYNPILDVCQIICLELKDRFVPMLCSGRRDKNKKLIYDGDVIDCLGNNCKRAVALSDGCWVVKCTQGGYFEDRDYELSLWDSLDSKNDEIIGNIHENEGA